MSSWWLFIITLTSLTEHNRTFWDMLFPQFYYTYKVGFVEVMLNKTEILGSIYLQQSFQDSGKMHWLTDLYSKAICGDLSSTATYWNHKTVRLNCSEAVHWLMKSFDKINIDALEHWNFIYYFLNLCVTCQDTDIANPAKERCHQTIANEPDMGRIEVTVVSTSVNVFKLQLEFDPVFGGTCMCTTL